MLSIAHAVPTFIASLLSTYRSARLEIYKASLLRKL
jgi:hypothetical protein